MYVVILIFVNKLLLMSFCFKFHAFAELNSFSSCVNNSSSCFHLCDYFGFDSFIFHLLKLIKKKNRYLLLMFHKLMT